MAKARFLLAACAVAIVAASPAFAQGTPAGDTSARGRSAGGRAARRATMTPPSSTSQNAAVDRLNDQSYQAAQQGQTLNGSSSGGSDTSGPATSGTGK